jgi:hypothetical protein
MVIIEREFQLIEFNYFFDEHLKTVKKIKFSPNEYVTSEINKSTETLLKQMKISIT